MHLKRCFLVSIVICILITSGCAPDLTRARYTAQPHPQQPQTVPLYPHRTITPVLYFPNQNRTKLVTETRTLTVGQDEPAENAIVNALIDGPQGNDLRPIGTGLSFDRVEITTEVINVYLNRDPDYYMSSTEITAGKLAVAATLIDYSGVRCVNVMLNGVQTAYEDPVNELRVPTGALTRATDLIDEFNALDQRASAPNPEMYVVFYFLDAAETFLLPELQRMTFPRDEDMVQLLIDRMLQGPDNHYNYQPVLDPAVLLESYELVQRDDGENWLRLVFNRMPVVRAGGADDGQDLALGAIAYTLCGFIPGISAVEISTHRNLTETIVCHPQEYAAQLGCRISICLPNTPAGMTMTTVERVLPQMRAWQPYAVLTTLFEGPVGRDSRNVWPAVPDGITVSQILDVYLAGNVLVINFDTTVPAILAQASAADEEMMVFSIINTMTASQSVRRVLFLVDGERRRYLGNETICILDPLMRNPGIVK